MELRKRIEALLRGEDPTGSLEVREDGPHWISQTPLYLSYSHTEGVALLVWSPDHPLGVDVETLSRNLHESPLRIAERFFSEGEITGLRMLAHSAELLKNAFFSLWLKKEALGKLTRKGLRMTIHLEVDAQNAVIFEEVPLVPEGYRAIVALGPH
jgi:phosphopantetheinyl transferase